MAKDQRAVTGQLRAAIYCRVSSSGQEDKSSLGTQEAALRTVISGVAE